LIRSYIILIIVALGYTARLDGQKAVIDETQYIQLKKTLQSARETSNPAELAESYFKLAEYEENINKKPELAFDYYVSAKQYYNRSQNVEKENMVNAIIAKKYVSSGFIAEAISIYEDLLSYYTKNKDDRNIANIYYELHRAYNERGESERATLALHKSISINIKLKDTTLLTKFSLDQVKNYISLGELDSALITSAKVVNITSITKDKPSMSKALYYLGYINAIRKDFIKAEKYLLNSLSMTKPLPYDEARKNTYKALVNMYARQEKFKDAYIFSTKYNSLNDSILNNNRQRAIDDLSIRHQAEEKEKNIRFLEIENKSVLQKILLTRSALYFVAAGFFALLLALYYIIRFYSQKIKNETIINTQQHEIDSQKIRELEDRIKISSMQSMIVGQEKERERIAIDLHDSLGGLLSAVKLQFDNVKTKLNGAINQDQYHKATDLLDTAVEEVRNISRNLQPGSLKDLGLVPAINDLINRFDHEHYPEIYFQHYNLDDKLEEMTALNIYRIVQELLNNSVKHAAAKEILIQITREDEEIIIEFEDDGKGIEIVNTNKRKGMGLDNINSRVNYLKGTITVNSQPQEGVSYLIRIPYVTTAKV
jgi:signal transduction histidine kinase